MPYNVYYIPSGPKNLADLFSLDWSRVKEYYIQISTSGDEVIATSPTYSVDKYCEDDAAIHFQNSLGAVDSIPMKLIDVEHETKADTYQTPDSSPFVRSQHGINRFGIRSTDSFEGSVLLAEDQLMWLQELIDSPNVWMELDGISEEVDSDYIPVVILDQKIQVLKADDKYEYQISILFTLSHDKIILQN